MFSIYSTRSLVHSGSSESQGLVLVLSRFRLFYIAVGEVVSVDFLPARRLHHHSLENFLITQFHFPQEGAHVPSSFNGGMAESQDHAPRREGVPTACMHSSLHTYNRTLTRSSRDTSPPSMQMIRTLMVCSGFSVTSHVVSSCCGVASIGSRERLVAGANASRRMRA